MPLPSRAAWALLFVLVAAAAAALWPAHDPATAETRAVAAPDAPRLDASAPAPLPGAPAAAGADGPTQGGAMPPAAAASGARSANGVFQADAQGRLVVDERMRLAVEGLAGRHPAEALPALIDAEVQGLPPAAAAAARELAQRLDAYQSAQRAAFPPGTAPLVPQEGLAELEAVVALRTSYFGADAARRMFGADEQVARRLLQLMAEDTSTTLSMEQKAMRAQQRYDQERAATTVGR